MILETSQLRFAQHRATTIDLFGDNWLDVPVERFPHYRYLAGDHAAFREYLAASWQTTAGIDEHLKGFEKRLCAAGNGGVAASIRVCARGTDWLVVDGNHRAAIAAFLYRPVAAVAVSLQDYAHQVATCDSPARYGAPNGIPYQPVVYQDRTLVVGRRDLRARHELIRSTDLHGRVLDIGCNLGTSAFWAYEQGADVTGWEVNPTIATQAIRLAVAFGYPIDFRTVDASKPPAGEWDTGFCFSVHEHCDVRPSLAQCQVVYLEMHRPEEPSAKLVAGFDVERLGEYEDGGRRRLYRLERLRFLT